MDKNKSLQIFKRFKKNEIVIYAIALMLVTAGYFNYTANIKEGTLETYSNEIEIAKEVESNSTNNAENIQTSEKIENNTNTEKEEHIGDATLVNSNDAVETTQSTENTEKQENTAETTENTITQETNANKAEKNETTGEEDYFVSSKLDRDTNYASMISTYTKILEDNTVSETQKSIAMKEITKINNTKNAISVCENIISTKGFENSVVFVNDNSVNVVVRIEGGLTPEKVAQIQNIVSRELNSEISDIHITEK